MNKKKDCTAANFGNYKQSDITKLGAGARILVALINGQPLKRIDLCEKAGVNPSLFGRYRRLLLKESIIKLTPNGYVLYNFIYQPTFWDKVKEKCLSILIGMLRYNEELIPDNSRERCNLSSDPVKF